MWLSAITLNATDAVLVHGDGLSVKLAEAVSTALAARNVRVESVQVSPFDPAATNSQLVANAEGLLTGRSLVYGPGTSAMNVAAYAAWLTANLDHPDTDAWWPEAQTGSLHSLKGLKVPFASADLDLERIAGLHGSEVRLQQGFDLQAPVAKLRHYELSAMSELIERWLTAPSQSTTKAKRSLPAPLRDLPGTNQDSGWLLELGVAILLTRWFTESGVPPDEIRLNTSVFVDGRQIVEFDVAFRWGERVLCVSCGKAAAYSQLRHKLFEVDTRAPQIFGRETRTLTVAHAREDIARPWAGSHDSLNSIWRHRRSRLGATWETRPRHAIVAARELFGIQPSTCLSRPADVFDQHNQAVGAWLLRCAKR